MAQAIVTPLTQALAEGKLTRDELKEIMQRSDWISIKRLIAWLGLLAVTTTLITLAWNSWLIWPAMFLQGVVLVHFFSLQHECVHYTVFRTRWLNDVVGQICGLVIILLLSFIEGAALRRAAAVEGKKERARAAGALLRRMGTCDTNILKSTCPTNVVEVFSV